MAAQLSKSVEKEATEMAASAKKNAGVVTLLEAGDFALKSHIKGQKVLLAVKASDPNYGSPLVFYSIYLPQKDGGSITFKLRCGDSDLKLLKPEFEDIIAGARTPDSRE